MTGKRAGGHFSATSLARRRRGLGLSQDALARRSGVATVTVQKLEEGRVGDPKGSTLAKLADALGCRVDALLVSGVPQSNSMTKTSPPGQ